MQGTSIRILVCMAGRDYQTVNDAARAMTSGADSILQTAEVVGDAWSWLVIREAVLHGVTRFAEFQVRLGIPRSTLSARLTQLTVAGLLARTAGRRAPNIT